MTFGAVSTPWLLTHPGEWRALAQYHLPEEPGGAWVAGPRMGQVVQPLPDVSRVGGIHGLDFAPGFAGEEEIDLSEYLTIMILIRLCKRNLSKSSSTWWGNMS